MPATDSSSLSTPVGGRAVGDALSTPPQPRLTLSTVCGNRCGHNPAVPCFQQVALPPDANHARPALISKAIGKAQGYYDTPREGRWDRLSQSERQRRLERQLHTVGGPDTAAGRPLAMRLAHWRQQRSERREALIAVLTLLLAYTDIATLTVAVPSGRDWLGLSIPWMARHTGLSPSRIKRALATLDRANLLASTGRGRQFDKRRRCWVGTGWGPVRRFSFHLIRILGLEVSWTKARKQHCKDSTRTERTTAATPTPSATRPIPTSILPLNTPTPTAIPLPIEPLETRRAHLSNLRQQLTGTPKVIDEAAKQATIARNRQIADWILQGLTPAEIRQRLNDTAQPP